MIETVLKDMTACTGCFACVNICPEKCIFMAVNEEGFWYPSVDGNRCTQCGQCVKACPIIKRKVIENNPKAFAVMAKNDKIRRESSSGGVFTLIAHQIIENNGVVFGAAFNADFELEHCFVDTKEELHKLRGSKYLQSKIGDSFSQAKMFLDEGRPVLFVGTPCQIAGIKNFLGKDYNHLFCIDFICHGVPSPLVFHKYLEHQRRKKKSPVQKVDFRDKRNGWELYGFSITYKNGKEYYQNRNKNLYINVFLLDICLRPSCYDCQFKTLNRQSDITLGDFWHIDKILPHMNDDKGLSLVFVNSDGGKDMFKGILKQMISEEVDIRQMPPMNKSITQSAKENPNRTAFFKEIQIKPIEKVISKYCNDKMYRRINRKIKGLMNIK
jgi:coenzyme F420-reducing hydrogenase beta subunit